MTRSSRPRKTIPDSVHRLLNSYALAASTAGIGMLGSPSAEAKIVYTPAHVPLAGAVIDLNHDGKRDIAFQSFLVDTSSFASRGIRVISAYSGGVNQIVARQSNAVALCAGAQIAPGKPFASQGLIYGYVYHLNPPRTSWFGQWANGGKGLKNHYVGIKFAINGKFHYGWARVSVTLAGRKASSLLTGYAYETIPGKAITAGATKAPDDAEPVTSLNTRTPQPATLGMLALGGPGLAIWRREETMAAALNHN